MKKENKRGAISTFLGPDVSFEGNIDFEGTIRLDGHVKGRISTRNGTLIVGEKAVLNADISVDVAIIMGLVNGTVEAREKIEVYPPGQVTGDIQAPVISIDLGATLNGSCSMRSQKIISGNGSGPSPKGLNG